VLVPAPPAALMLLLALRVMLLPLSVELTAGLQTFVNVATNGVLNISSVQDSKSNDYFIVKLHSDSNYFC
jgi:hypothetical protein